MSREQVRAQVKKDLTEKGVFDALKFTQGKWELDDKTGEIKCNGSTIAIVVGATYLNQEENAEECLGNARLIEAAPLLYKNECPTASI